MVQLSVAEEIEVEQAIIEYFSDLICKMCGRNFDDRSIRFLDRSGPYVVRITCAHCMQPLGTAVIAGPRGLVNPRIKPLPTLSAKDKKKFSELPPISDNEVLEFHELLKKLPTAKK